MMKSDFDPHARTMLRAAKLYVTSCRVAILRVLAEASGPISYEQVAKRSGKNRFNKVTIYRTLESFCNAGLVHKVFMGERAWHFELANRCSDTQCHPHFTCKKCGVTQCLTKLSFPIVKGLKKGFVVHRQQVRLEGLCPACA